MRGRRLIAYLLICVGFTLLLLKGSLRTYLWTKNGCFRFAFSSFIATQYLGVGSLLEHPVHRDDQRRKVLLLGPATFHPHYGNIEERLKSKLQERNIQVDLFNLSNAALTTRDGLFQYMALNSSTFDAERLIPKTGRYFNDICHLTADGCNLIAEALCAELALRAPARSANIPVKSAPPAERSDL